MEIGKEKPAINVQPVKLPKVVEQPQPVREPERAEPVPVKR